MPDPDKLFEALKLLRDAGYCVAVPNVQETKEPPGFIVGTREYIEDLITERHDHTIWERPS